jgi:hypothetical protein
VPKKSSPLEAVSGREAHYSGIRGLPTLDREKGREAEGSMIKSRMEWIVHGLDYDRLTDWEMRFVEDVEDRFKRRGDLTEKQEEILERIYKEKGR